MPDGSALVSRVPVQENESPVGPRRPLGLTGVARRHAAWAMSRWGSLAALASRVKGDEEYVPEDDFALGNPTSKPSSATLFLLGRVADARAAQLRRENYAFLLEKFPDLVLRPFDRLPEGASPFFFPVETDRKGELLGWFARRGVDALDFGPWPIPCFLRASRGRGHSGHG